MSEKKNIAVVYETKEFISLNLDVKVPSKIKKDEFVTIKCLFQGYNKRLKQKSTFITADPEVIKAIENSTLFGKDFVKKNPISVNRNKSLQSQANLASDFESVLEVTKLQEAKDFFIKLMNEGKHEDDLNEDVINSLKTKKDAIESANELGYSFPNLK